MQAENAAAPDMAIDFDALRKQWERDWWLTLADPVKLHAGGELFFTLTGRRGGGAFDLAKIKRILVLRPDAIGDMVLLTPFLRELRHNAPNAWITLIADPAVISLLEHNPHLNQIIPYRPKSVIAEWKNHEWEWQLANLPPVFEMARKQLAPRKYDLAVLPRWDMDYYHVTHLAYLSGVRWRVGYSEFVTATRANANPHWNELLTTAIDDRTIKHEVERNLELLTAMGGTVRSQHLELHLTADDHAQAERLLRRINLGATPIIAIGANARVKRRVWAHERFIELARTLQHDYNATIVLVGAPEDYESLEQIRAHLDGTVLNTAGQVSLRELAALLGHCQLYIGNDTGPMHIAAAMGCAVVEISCHPYNGWALHSNSPFRFGPWQVPHVILQPTATPPCTRWCRQDHAHCILNITVDEVQAAVASLLPLSTPRLAQVS